MNSTYDYTEKAPLLIAARIDGCSLSERKVNQYNIYMYRYSVTKESVRVLLCLRMCLSARE